MENNIAIMQEPVIIYEDEHIVAVNKPAGLLVHPTPAMVRHGTLGDETKGYTLTDWIMRRYPNMKEVGECAHYDGVEIPRPGIVHRLDKETSGVLVIAKDNSTFAFLKQQFKERNIAKTYQAIVYGKVPKDHGVISDAIGRDKKDVKRWATGAAARGVLREATTEYKVIARGKEYSFLELYPKTGRTHQIRVHLHSIHHPVVGDHLYAPKRPFLPGLSRMALHAVALVLSLPHGVSLRLEAPLPPDMEAAVANIDKS